MMNKFLFLVIAVLLFAGLSAGCGGDEGGGGGGTYACSYEKRTSGCNNYTYGAWQSDCFSFNADDYYITPEQVCQNVTESGLYCASSCCISSQFQNVVLQAGACP